MIREQDAPTRKVHQSSHWRALSLKMRRAHPMCCYCMQHLDRITDYGLEVDHIIPISRGGAKYSKDNLQVLCKDCHIAKHTPTNPASAILNMGGITEAEVKQAKKDRAVVWASVMR